MLLPSSWYFITFLLQIGDKLFVPLADESGVDINVTLLRSDADIGNILVSMCVEWVLRGCSLQVQTKFMGRGGFKPQAGALLRKLFDIIHIELWEYCCSFEVFKAHRDSNDWCNICICNAGDGVKDICAYNRSTPYHSYTLWGEYKLVLFITLWVLVQFSVNLVHVNRIYAAVMHYNPEQAHGCHS